MADDRDQPTVGDEGLGQALAFLGRRHTGAEAIDDMSLDNRASGPPAPSRAMAAGSETRPPPPAPIALDLAGALGDVLDGRGLAITVAGLPAGAQLSAGSDNRDGSWSLGPGDLDGLTISLSADAEAELTLSVTAAVEDGAGRPRPVARLAVSIVAVDGST